MSRAFLLKLVRNVLGVLLILMGALLGFVPFLPGIVLGVLGVSLLDFPGKRRLLRKIGSLPLFVRLRRRSPVVARFWQRVLREGGRGYRRGKVRLTPEKPLE